MMRIPSLCALGADVTRRVARGRRPSSSAVLDLVEGVGREGPGAYWCGASCAPGGLRHAHADAGRIRRTPGWGQRAAAPSAAGPPLTSRRRQPRSSQCTCRTTAMIGAWQQARAPPARVRPVARLVGAHAHRADERPAQRLRRQWHAAAGRRPASGSTRRRHRAPARRGSCRRPCAGEAVAGEAEAGVHVPPGADSKNGSAGSVMSMGPLQAASKRTPSSCGNSQTRPSAAASASRGDVSDPPPMRVS